MVNIKASYSSFSVNNLKQAREFYEQTLGLAVDSDAMGFRLNLPGDKRLFIYEKGGAHQPATFTVLNFVVDNIDEAVDELTQRGVTFEHYDNMPFPASQDEKNILRGLAVNQGPDIAWFKDPAGNVIAVLQEA